MSLPWLCKPSRPTTAAHFVSAYLRCSSFVAVACVLRPSASKDTKQFGLLLRRGHQLLHPEKPAR
eukprot:5396103-Alexandrium_andersonii.AAC.1